MIQYIFLLILPLSLYASNILSYNIYEKSDYVDLMITFDTPYSGTIKQSINKNKIIIKLENAQIESSKVKKVDSNFLHEITITPLENETQCVAFIAPSVRLMASKTSDSYGLRLRFVNKVALHSTTNADIANQTNLSALPTQKSEIVSTRYYIVIGMMFLGIIILFMVKKKIEPTKSKKPKSSWLFNSNRVANQAMKQTAQTPADTKTVTIRFQKVINDINSVVMLDFGSESYLVLMGNSNILLDKFTDNVPVTQQEFETVLQERNEELEDFLGSASHNNRTQTYKEPLQAYKERAASLIYSDEDR